MTPAQTLAEVLDILESREHAPDCARIRDDYECTCGRDDLIGRVEVLWEAAMRRHDFNMEAA